jgi:hypothetical protein
MDDQVRSVALVVRTMVALVEHSTVASAECSMDSPARLPCIPAMASQASAASMVEAEVLTAEVGAAANFMTRKSVDESDQGKRAATVAAFALFLFAAWFNSQRVEILPPDQRDKREGIAAVAF